MVPFPALFGTASTDLLSDGNPVLRAFLVDEVQEAAVLRLGPRPSPVAITTHSASPARRTDRLE
jgi:hypothetical protein